MHGPGGLVDEAILAQSRFHSGPWGTTLDMAPNIPCRLTVKANADLNVTEILKEQNVAICQARGVLTRSTQQKV